jgi:DNA-binding transcriptional ArsR family regulator
VLVVHHVRFVYDQNMTTHPDLAASRIAALIGEPARARILYSLVDGRARTSTELAAIAGISLSTTSVHLNLLKDARLVTLVAQGKHHYHSLANPDVARILEGLSVLAGASGVQFVPNTPVRLRLARTCYDHIAGRLGVLLHDRFRAAGWISANSTAPYDVTAEGERVFRSLGIDFTEIRSLRRKFAYPCLDWSERQPHIGGSLGAAMLRAALKLKWVVSDLDSRSLQITAKGKHELMSRLGIELAVRRS